LSVYESEDFDTTAKGDGSPLTRADRLAHEAIQAGLTRLTPALPVLSEESPSKIFDQRRGWETFWLVDPLDGTKEFIHRNGEFTVNIALVCNGVPCFGIVAVPASGAFYLGGAEYGSWALSTAGQRSELKAKHYTGGEAIVVASRSHRGAAVDHFIEKLALREGPPRVRSMGSSLKLCLIAEGVADVYPRLGKTSEWDTAAAHAIVVGAGGGVTDVRGVPLSYNKPSVLNPWFLAFGSGHHSWTDYVPGDEDQAG
jgi:3'(2'), 5'-bisphosphate nucleotidase